MVFEDETGFSLHPRLSVGWAKRGKRLRVPTTSQHRHRLNIFGWVAPLLGRTGLMRAPSGNRAGFLECLKQICQRLRGYTIWLYVDRASWHMGMEVKEFLSRHTRLRIRYLPRYQPGLNMQERIWRQIRYEATTNRWFETLEITWETVIKTTYSWSPKKVKRLCQIC